MENYFENNENNGNDENRGESDEDEEELVGIVERMGSG